MLNYFLNNNKNLSIRLSNKAKRELYIKFFFYNLSLISSFKSIIESKNISFKGLLLNNFFLYKYIPSNGVISLLKAQVLVTNSSFLYFDTGGKYTVLKPKFKAFFLCSFKNLLSKQVLLFFQDSLLSFLRIKNIFYLIKLYNFPSVIKNYVVNLKFFYCKKSFLRRFIYSHIFYTKYFSFYKLFNIPFSNFQKKINFLQFNIFFKKI
jgi:hypothetical protein